MFSLGCVLLECKELLSHRLPRIVLVKVCLERVISAWCYVPMHKTFDDVLLEPCKDYACCRVRSSQSNEITYMRVSICVIDREEDFVVYDLVIWILLLADCWAKHCSPVPRFPLCTTGCTDTVVQLGIARVYECLWGLQAENSLETQAITGSLEMCWLICFFLQADSNLVSPQL